MIQLGQQRHLHTKTVELEKVKRNRTALDIKSGFVFIYEEALVYGGPWVPVLKFILLNKKSVLKILFVYFISFYLLFL